MIIERLVHQVHKSFIGGVGEGLGLQKYTFSMSKNANSIDST